MTPEMVIVPALPWRPPWRIIVDRIARRHGTTYERAVSKGKRRNERLMVRVEMARALHAEGLNTVEISHILDRDHTVVCWYLGHLNNPRRRKLP